jgi:hypothetical protein
VGTNTFDLANTAKGATNGLGAAAFVGTNTFDLASTAKNATNGLGTAAWQAAGSFDTNGAGTNAALAATNGLGTAAWKATGYFDTNGAGTNAALAATNGLSTAAWQAAGYFDTNGAGTNAALAATNRLGTAAYSATTAFDTNGAGTNAALAATNGLGTAAWLAAASCTNQANVASNALLAIVTNTMTFTNDARATFHVNANSSLGARAIGTVFAGSTVTNAANGGSLGWTNATPTNYVAYIFAASGTIAWFKTNTPSLNAAMANLPITNWVIPVLLHPNWCVTGASLTFEQIVPE